MIDAIRSIFIRSRGKSAAAPLSIDWLLFASLIPLLGAGLVTMSSFVGENFYLEKQLISIGIALVVFFILSFIDFRFLRRTGVVVIAFVFACALLGGLFVLGHVSKGAQSWFRFGTFGFQPVDMAKLVLILVMAKYFSRRHIEIANFRHILVSAVYAGIMLVLVLLQPDFGSALIIFSIWFGMVLVSGISKKHLLLVFVLGAVAFGGLWNFAFQPYQKERIRNFINPLQNVRGTGYNAYQSMIATGSGKLFGKGIGYGTQSRLKFLPEYQTDFIFSAFAEEWGFVGVLMLFVLWTVLIWRILRNASYGATNFEMLFGMGLAIFFMSHFIIHVGMNIGVLPVTGLPMPFMSYGGSHILAEFIGLGILMGMRRYARDAHKDAISNEFSGLSG